MEEYENFDGQQRDGDRIYVDRPLSQIIEAENNAVVSIVLGALGIFFSELVFGFILGIFAIKYSKKVKDVLNSRHHKYHIATAGEICGWVSIGLSAFALVTWIVYLILIFVVFA